MAKTNGTISIPGYRRDPMFRVRVQDTYLVIPERGEHRFTEEPSCATSFIVRDGEWNADGWARRLNGTVEVVE